MIRGSCLCGAVRFAIDGRVGHSSACHCGMCRKQSGHVWGAVGTERAWLTIDGDVRWYAASDVAQRGFCPVCGSFLFWQGQGNSAIAIALGAFDDLSGVAIEQHIYTSDKGDYYVLPDDGLPRS